MAHQPASIPDSHQRLSARMDLLPLLHHYSFATLTPLDHYLTTTGCPTWIKSRTFEANRAFSEGGP
jgi:hypothetical protein